jgi:hypothetical protein
MLNLRRISGTALVIGVLLAALTGCEKGPAQKAGEDIDKAVDEVGEAMEKAGDDIREAVGADRN